jgi:hypothetical protein
MAIAGLGDTAAGFAGTNGMLAGLGTKPKYAISCGAVSKRRKSPISATMVVAVSRSTPRSAM